MGICNSKRDDYDARVREADRAMRERVDKLEAAPTPEARQALLSEASAAAEAYMEAVLKAAAEAPKERKEQVAQKYREYGGFKLEALALNGDTDLIDIKYLIRLAELGGRVERNQDAPACAKIGPDDAWRLRGWNEAFSAPYFVISYPWFDKDHPDRHGHTLRRMLPILRAVLAEAQKHGGEHATVAVMWDVMSLVQGPDRTPEQQERFERALGSINEWYMHPYSIVLAVTTPIPAGKGYTNTRAYMKRGWCYIELRMSSLVKYSGCLWDLSLHEEGQPITFRNCRIELNTSRLPFMSPDRVARELTEGVASGALAFTAQADSELVSKIYRRAFVKALETFARIRRGVIFYSKLGWGSEAVPVLVEALEYAQEHCTMWKRQSLSFSGNKFTKADKAAIRAAIPANSTKFRISST